MHPALSVIFFTVVSGCGFGTLFLLSAVVALEPQSISTPIVALSLASGFVMAAAGLMSSLLHLGRPLRAWRAFSQWRSSWLSREGVAAMHALAAAVLLAALLLWREPEAALRTVACALAVLSAACVVCTAQIYATLRTVPAWHNGFVLPGYLLFALLGGSAWLWLYAVLGGAQMLQLALPPLLLVAAVASVAHKRMYWRHVDRAPATSTPESATGLGRFGAVRSAEAPHTEENYLTREMGFAVARKHARRLRRIALALIGGGPVAMTVFVYLLAAAPFHVLGAAAAALSVTCGLFVERWLFFAEAKHVVMLYYSGETRSAQHA